MRPLALFLAVFWTGQALACAPNQDDRELIPETETSLKGYVAIAPYSLSQPFDMELSLCGDGLEAIERVEVDAIMPAHQHGMNYEPRVEPKGAGEFSVSGMVFHMPGDWQVQVTVLGGGDRHHFTLDVEAR